MSNETTPPDRNLLNHWATWVVVVIVLTAVVGGYAFLKVIDRVQNRRPAELDKAFVYDVERYKGIPVEKIGWEEVARIPTRLSRATALTVGRSDEIIVGGEMKVVVHAADGKPIAEIPVPETVLALTTSPTGEILLAAADRVGRCAIGEPVRWIANVPGDRARITSIAADRTSVYVADAGARAVWRFTLSGRPLGRIGDKDPRRNIPGFNVPSPYFDLLLAPDGLLRIVDPGRHQITAFTKRGDLEITWGKPSFELEGFSGCCNPSHLAMLPDGRFVTSEKGIPRVKVHDVDGSFVTAVVGTDGLDTETDPCDVAADSAGRIVVLDPGSGTVRIFTPKGGADRED